MCSLHLDGGLAGAYLEFTLPEAADRGDHPEWVTSTDAIHTEGPEPGPPM